MISGNAANGIYIVGGSDHTIQGNHIGTTASGMSDLGNGESGIRIEESSENLVGGASVAARNIIGANANGVSIVGSMATGNHVAGNYIGVAEDGVTDLGNTFRGVFVGGHGITTLAGAGNVIGGPSHAERNVISGNGINGYGVGNIFLKELGDGGPGKLHRHGLDREGSGRKRSSRRCRYLDGRRQERFDRGQPDCRQ